MPEMTSFEWLRKVAYLGLKQCGIQGFMRDALI
jgi:hypothetical protein